MDKTTLRPPKSLESIATLEDAERERAGCDTLHEQLEWLPRRLQHAALVPLSEVGFIQGELHRTNEVLCHIGDGHFVWKSAYEAQQLLERRKAHIDARADQMPVEVPSVRQFHDMLHSQEALSQAIQAGVEERSREGVVDIQERYSTEQEALDANRLAPSPGAPHRSIDEVKREIQERDDSAIFARLDELARLEEEAGEADEAEIERRILHRARPERERRGVGEEEKGRGRRTSPGGARAAFTGAVTERSTESSPPVAAPSQPQRVSRFRQAMARKRG